MLNFLNTLFLNWPWAAAAAAVVLPALVALYFLKLRRRQMVVSSTLLWKKAIHDLQVNAPFQKLRRNLLLLLQLLLLIALLIALARPILSAVARGGQRMVIVIDQSASMNATDVSPNRLEVAKGAALKLVDEFEGSGGVMVVAFAQRAQVVQPFTTDRALLRSAIHAISPTDQASHLEPALQLFERYAIEAGNNIAATGGAGGDSLRVEVLSDGQFQESSRMALRGGKLIFRQVGKDATTHAPDNVAIVALSARRDFARPQRTQIFTRLVNYGDLAVTANVMLSVDGTVRNVTPVTVPAAAPPVVSATGEVTFPPPGEHSVQFELTLSSSALVSVAHDHADALMVDNSAALNIAPPRQMRVLLVTSGNAFLEKVIESIGVQKLVTMSPKRYEDQDPMRLRRDSAAAPGATGGGDEGFDVIVFDDYGPRQTPPVDSLYLGAVPAIDRLERRPTTVNDPQTQVFLDWKRDHPLLRYVALDDVLLVEPGRLIVPEDGRVLATGQAGPVMAEVTRDGVRHVVLSFNVLKTNWPMQVSFAVFMSNALDLLSLSGASHSGVSFRPGEVAAVPVGQNVKSLDYEGPVKLSATADQGMAVLPMFERAGVYVQDRSDAQPPWDKLAVNVTDVIESDLRPADRLEVGTVAVQAVGQDTFVRQEVWRWFVWAALAMLMIEWLVYTRRMYL